MNILKISIKNIFHKPLYTFLNVLSLSASIGLLIGVWQLDTSVKYQFENSLGPIDLVVGAKGSPLQLVLASVLHIDNPTGNISYTEAQKIAKNPMINTAVPISYGDNYKGYRIVGTTEQFPLLYGAQLDAGREMRESMEAVLGHSVAERLGLSVGDTFVSSHGLVENDVDVHDSAPFTVVGVYGPTYKVLDRLIVTPTESIWDVHEGHDHDNGTGKNHHAETEHDHDHDHEEAHDDREITSLLISFRNPTALLTLPRRINEDTEMQAALPKYEMERLFQFTGIGIKTISWVAYLILVISCISIFIGLFKMVKERAFDLALLRTYGAGNWQLVKMVAYEGLLITFIALFFGILLSQIGLYFIFKMILEQYKQNIPLQISYEEGMRTGGVVVLMVLLAIAMAIYPLLKMNISKILSHEK